MRYERPTVSESDADTSEPELPAAFQSERETLEHHTASGRDVTGDRWKWRRYRTSRQILNAEDIRRLHDALQPQSHVAKSEVD